MISISNFWRWRTKERKFYRRELMILLILFSLTGCYIMRSSSGGGQTDFEPPRKINSADIALPQGYEIDAVARDFTFPTGVTFDDEGNVYVIEAGYSYGEVWTTPRLIQVAKDGGMRVIAEGGKNGPWTGVTFRDGYFYVAEGGELEGGRILRISRDGAITPLIDNLPSRGDHHTNGPVFGPDNFLYFTIGVGTNSGIVGEDNFTFGWLKRYEGFHDVPCSDVTLTGENYRTKNFLGEESDEEVLTGAFVPFGTETKKGQVVKGNVPCSGALMRMSPEGGTPELVAWGFRNPFGLAFSQKGEIYVTDNMYDSRGSRPIFGAGDLLWKIESGKWYGWPDYHGEHALFEGERYKVVGKEKVKKLLMEDPGDPPKPVAIFGVHASADGFDFSRSSSFGHVGDAFVALLGDEVPATGKVLSPVGYKVVRVDVGKGIIYDFAVNKGKTNGPASKIGGGGLERPVAARFNPAGDSLYVVDFGVMLHDKQGAKPQKSTGVLWRIFRTKEEGGRR